MDECIAKVVLSQTMTTQDGSSLSQAQVHAGVKLEVVKSDADLLSDSFNAGPARLPSFHQGVLGYAKRFGAPLEVEVNSSRSAYLVAKK
jgi:hypothetical protein